MDIKIDLSSIKLKTERLILRAFENRDLKDLYEYAKIPGLGDGRLGPSPKPRR